MGNTLNAQEQNISDADAKQSVTERSSNMSYVAAYLCCARNGFVKKFNYLKDDTRSMAEIYLKTYISDYP